MVCVAFGTYTPESVSGVLALTYGIWFRIVRRWIFLDRYTKTPLEWILPDGRDPRHNWAL